MILRTDEQDFIKIKNCKHAIKWIRQFRVWENIFARDTSNGYTKKKNSLKLSNKEHITQVKKKWEKKSWTGKKRKAKNTYINPHIVYLKYYLFKLL